MEIVMRDWVPFGRNRVEETGGLMPVGSYLTPGTKSEDCETETVETISPSFSPPLTMAPPCDTTNATLGVTNCVAEDIVGINHGAIARHGDGGVRPAVHVSPTACSLVAAPKSDERSAFVLIGVGSITNRRRLVTTLFFAQ